MKYGVKDVFDMKFFNKKEGLAFVVDTCVEAEIKRVNGVNHFVISDALVDVDLLRKVLRGDYDDLEFKISCESSFRSVEDMMDYKVRTIIRGAKMKSYSFPLGIDPSIVTFEFEFDTFKLMTVEGE